MGIVSGGSTTLKNYNPWKSTEYNLPKKIQKLNKKSTIKRNY